MLKGKDRSVTGGGGPSAETPLGGGSLGGVVYPDPTWSTAELAGTTQGFPLLTTRPENLSVALLTLP